MGFSTSDYLMMAMAAGSAIASASAKGPTLQAPTAPPQASQVPNAQGVRQGMAGTGQGGGSPGVAQTFLSGVSGVDPSLLQLGRSTLLGGGTGTPSGTSALGS